MRESYLTTSKGWVQSVAATDAIAAEVMFTIIGGLPSAKLSFRRVYSM